jgi:hypothetical protein
VEFPFDRKKAIFLAASFFSATLRTFLVIFVFLARLADVTHNPLNEKLKTLKGIKHRKTITLPTIRI